MSVFATMVLSGPGIGCVAAGWIEQNRHLEWRWIQWIHVMCVHSPPFSCADRAVCHLYPCSRGMVQLARIIPHRRAYMHEGDPRGRAPDAAREEDAQGDQDPPLPRAYRGRACQPAHAHIHLVHTTHLCAALPAFPFTCCLLTVCRPPVHGACCCGV